MRRVWMILLVLSSLSCLSLRADVTQFAKAIARTEGFYVVNSKAARYHNPGNLRSHGRYRRFASNRAGWAALYRQLYRIRAGESVYDVDMTLSQFGNVYACGHRIWAKNVAKILDVPLSSKIADILDTPLEPVQEYGEIDFEFVDAETSARLRARDYQCHFSGFGPKKKRLSKSWCGLDT